MLLPKKLNIIFVSKTRNAGEQFAHIHNVRLMWLQAANPDLLKKKNKIEKKKMITQKALAGELNKSAKAIASLLEAGFELGKIKGLKPHPSVFWGYLISLESHHRSQIILCLKQAGHPVDKKIVFGLWEWGTK